MITCVEEPVPIGKTIDETDDDSPGDDNNNHDEGTQNNDDDLGNQTYKGGSDIKRECSHTFIKVETNKSLGHSDYSGKCCSTKPCLPAG